MDIGSILISLALALVVGTYIGIPILTKSGRAVTVEDRRLSELQAQRDRILNRVQELDMDFTMGKILDADYKSERASLMQQGAEVLKTIDALVGGTPVPDSKAAPDDEIEAAVARLRGKSPVSSAGYCPSCGAGVQSGDAFCTHCGTSLQATEAIG
jgi:hypothetical protein